MLCYLLNLPLSLKKDISQIKLHQWINVSILNNDMRIMYHYYVVFLSGLAFLHLHLATSLGSRHSDEYLEDALDYLKEPLRLLKRRRQTFLCGDGGPLALGAVIYNKLGQKNKSQECIKRYNLQI